MSNQVNLIIALAIGALISAVLLVLEPMTNYAILILWLEMPGIAAAFFFWGSSPFVGIAITWAVNALVYGLVAFAVLTALGAMAAKPKSS